eukprot:2331660-Rhodomonas_salina.1
MSHEGMLLFWRYLVENRRIPRYCTMLQIFEHIYEERHGKQPPDPEAMFNLRSARMLDRVKVTRRAARLGKAGAGRA